MTNATDKQMAFLSTLMDERDQGVVMDLTNDMELFADGIPLTKSHASYLIGELLKAPRRGGGRAKQPREDVEHGFYRLADGDVAVVKWNRAKTNKYAMRLVVTTHGEMTGTPADAENATMEWVYERGLIGKCTKAAGARPLTLEEAAEYGKLYGRCMVCGRTLTDPKSIEAGIGPICAGRF